MLPAHIWCIKRQHTISLCIILWPHIWSCHETIMSCSGLFGQGHHPSFDNSSSLILFQELYKLKTFPTATELQNRRGLPSMAIAASLKNQEITDWRKNGLLFVAYQDDWREPVILLSTAASAISRPRPRSSWISNTSVNTLVKCFVLPLKFLLFSGLLQIIIICLIEKWSFNLI